MLVLTDTDPAISSEDFLQFEEILGNEIAGSHEGFLSQVQRWPAPSKGCSR